MAEVIQPSQVQLIKNRDQVIFAWTDAKSDARTIKNLKEIGVEISVLLPRNEKRSGPNDRRKGSCPKNILRRRQI